MGKNVDDNYSLEELSEMSDVPLSILKEVFRRGQGAWTTNIQSVRRASDFKKDFNLSRTPRSARLGKEQWGYARVYSFLDKGKTWHTADSDLAKEVRERHLSSAGIAEGPLSAFRGRRLEKPPGFPA